MKCKCGAEANVFEKGEAYCIDCYLRKIGRKK